MATSLISLPRQGLPAGSSPRGLALLFVLLSCFHGLYLPVELNIHSQNYQHVIKIQINPSTCFISEAINYLFQSNVRRKKCLYRSNYDYPRIDGFDLHSYSYAFLFINYENTNRGNRAFLQGGGVSHEKEESAL